MLKKSLLHITATSICNLNCTYCSEGVREKGYLLDYALLKDLQELNAQIPKDLKKGHEDFEGVVFSSGEPTLNYELATHIKLARDLNYNEIQLVTNGIRISDIRYLLQLKESGLNSLTISVNSFSPSISKKVSGNGYDGAKTAKGILNAIQLSIPTRVNIVINKYTLISLHHTLIYLLNLGIKNVVLSFMRYDGFRDVLFTGYNRVNENKVTYENFVEYCKKYDIASILTKFGLVCLNDFPLCVIKNSGLAKKYFHRSKNFTFYDNETGYIHDEEDVGVPRMLLDQCRKCSFKNECCGIETEYFDIFGSKQLKKEIITII